MFRCFVSFSIRWTSTRDGSCRLVSERWSTAAGEMWSAQADASRRSFAGCFHTSFALSKRACFEFSPVSASARFRSGFGSRLRPHAGCRTRPSARWWKLLVFRCVVSGRFSARREDVLRPPCCSAASPAHTQVQLSGRTISSAHTCTKSSVYR